MDYNCFNKSNTILGGLIGLDSTWEMYFSKRNCQLFIQTGKSLLNETIITHADHGKWLLITIEKAIATIIQGYQSQ